MAASRFLTASGSSIYVEDAGSGPVVLAIHGLGGGAWFFRSLADRLAPDYRTIAVDLPGTGRSTSTTRPRTLSGWVDDLGDLARSVSPVPLVVLGHSLGTIIALDAWRRWPEQIRAMVFVGGLPRARPASRARLSERRDVAARLGLSGLAPLVSQAVFSPATFRDRPEVVGLFERIFESQDAAEYIECIDVLLGASGDAVVPTIRVPCLAVSGNDDQYAPPDDVATFVQAIPMNVRQARIRGCGHLPFLERPDAFAHEVRAFMETLA